MIGARTRDFLSRSVKLGRHGSLCFKMVPTKRKCLSFEEKSEVQEKFKSDISKEQIMSQYGIRRDTYYRIINGDLEITNPHSYNLKGKRKSSKKSDNDVLDAGVIEWFIQERDNGNSISGPVLKEIALILHQMVNGSSNFKVSTYVEVNSFHLLYFQFTLPNF